MLESQLLISRSSPGFAPYEADPAPAQEATFSDVLVAKRSAGIFAGLQRRLRRERRRRKVGRAYDMALEISRAIPSAYEILDVGCGNGFIAHHLAGLLGCYVVGIDVDGQPEAPINFHRYDGKHFPAADRTFEAALFCYVLHHAQDIDTIFAELRRVLRNDGLVVVYEDIPATVWDRFVCGIHNLQWRGRTGECTFRNENEWRKAFQAAGFEVIQQRQLSRWRNLAHPVRRQSFLLRLTQSAERTH